MAGLLEISFHLDLSPAPNAITQGVRGAGGHEAATSIEDTARAFLLGLVLDSVPSVRGVAEDLAPEEGFAHALTTEVPALGWDMKEQETHEELVSSMAGAPTHFVCFQQTHADVPIFGAQAIVELHGGVPLGVSGHASHKPVGSPQPTLSPEQALAAAARGGTTDGASAERVYFAMPEGWHLAYHVRGVCVPRESPEPTITAHGPGRSPRADSQLRDVLVDAHDGVILLEYSAVPLVAIAPSYAKGLDEEDNVREFYTQVRSDGTFELRDGLNSTTTYDAAGADIEGPRPPDPVRHDSGDWQGHHRAAVTAHNNAVVVLDYFRTKLKRSGIDNKNTEVVSIVRSTYKRHEKPPVWRNAVWWKDAMWYGQVYEAHLERYVSFATRLDIAAHEMTHGLIQNTANLIYFAESGALNESICDIFAVIIANSERVSSSTTKNWSWTIGAGLGVEGKDIRDLANPQRLGYPGHYDDYVKTLRDSGGVHINSNIHNRAAYNLLTAVDADGQVFGPDEVALLYYLALLRLGAVSTFRDALIALHHAAATLYRNRNAQRALAAITKAYADAGIVA
jgi:bacillolysin